MHMKTTERVNLQSLAADAYEERDGDFGKATALLTKRLLGNPQHIKDNIEEIAYSAVTQHMRRFRGTYFTGSNVPKPEPTSARDTEIAEAEKNLKRWYLMPLPGGRKLGDAVKGELDLASELHRSHARGNLIRARLYDGISERMPDELKTVSSVLSEDDIEEIARGES